MPERRARRWRPRGQAFGPNDPIGLLLATPLTAFGDPTTTTDYTLCVYDDDTTLLPVILRATAPAGGTCGPDACWETKTYGFTYRDRELTPDGLSSVKLKAASMADRLARLTVKGKRANLPLPPTLPTGRPVLAQLHAITGSTDACWSGSFTTPSKNTPSTFKARFP